MERIHGMSKTRFYGIWNDIMMRCYNPKKERYPRYGGRGIIVCERWHTFNNFYIDMFPTYKKGLSIERDNVNGNYEPDNCRWIPKKDQFLNRANTIRLTIDGETKSVTEWAIIARRSPFTIYKRLEKGWTHKDSVFSENKKKSLSECQIYASKEMFKNGMSMRKIAILFGTSHSVIAKIVSQTIP